MTTMLSLFCELARFVVSKTESLFERDEFYAWGCQGICIARTFLKCSVEAVCFYLFIYSILSQRYFGRCMEDIAREKLLNEGCGLRSWEDKRKLLYLDIKKKWGNTRKWYTFWLIFVYFMFTLYTHLLFARSLTQTQGQCLWKHRFIFIRRW